VNRVDWRAFWNESEQVRDADFRRQVGRTFRGEPYSNRQLEILATRLVTLLEPSPGGTLLDLACGNGLLTARLAPSFERITAVDFSRPLIEIANTHFKADNITYLVGDVCELESVQGVYDRVLLSAALQHLSPSQVEQLLPRLAQLVRPGGRIVLGDVADRARIWSFYRGISGRARYFLERARRQAIIGHWWSTTALLRLAEEHGWALTVHYQTLEHPNHYFRFDAVLCLPDRGDQPSSAVRYAGK